MDTVHTGRSKTQVVSASSRPAYSYFHVVSFEDTNLLGNVYYTRHVAWQGRCRELFLKDHAPSMLDELARDLRLVTLKVSCDYFEEVKALESIEIRMRLAHIRQHRIGLDFEYCRSGTPNNAIVAVGFQEVGCMRLAGSGLVPVPLPQELDRVLHQFQ